MFFSDKRNRFTCLNTLMLCAFLLTAGCGPASSTSEKSQEPSAAAPQPAAESVAQATGPVTETLWDKRADYEKEGQVVRFTDCGLYKGDTDELTGAKCEFKDGKWVLLEPKLEPKDNLIKNGDFSEWDENLTMPIGYTFDKVADATCAFVQENNDFISPPFSLLFQAGSTVSDASRFVQLNIDFTKGDIRSFFGKEVFLSGHYKIISNPSETNFSIDYLTYTQGNIWITTKMQSPFTNDWTKLVSKFTVRKVSKKCFLRLMFNSTGAILIDDLEMYRGYFPMLMDQ